MPRSLGLPKNRVDRLWLVAAAGLSAALGLTGCTCASGQMEDASARVSDAGVDSAVDAHRIDRQDLQAACRAVSSAFWGFFDRCTDDADRAVSMQVDGALAAAQPCTHLDDLQADVDDGVVSVDLGALDRCIAAWSAGCDYSLARLAFEFIDGEDIGIPLYRCPGAIQGHRMRGEPCGEFYECAGDDVCVGAATALSPSTCGGTCGPPTALGEPCAPPAPPCAAGLDCPHADVCRGPPMAGDPCQDFSDCWFSTFSLPAMYCGWESHTCHPAATLGQACGGSDRVPCDELTSFCIGSGGTICASASGVGGPCRPVIGYAGDCSHGLSCVAGACEPGGALGAACASSTDCATDLRCTSGLCAPLGSIGDTCYAFDGPYFFFFDGHVVDCAIGLWCVPSGPGSMMGSCRAQRFADDRCDEASACIGATCIAGTCVAPAPAGDPCSEAVPCTTGLCVAGVCDDPTCAPP